MQFAVERELTEREVENPNTNEKSAWKDVYVDGNFSDGVQVRAGKFKIPFGLEQLTGISNLDFVYRSLSASYLAPSRDIGVSAAWPLLRSRAQLLGRMVSPRWRQRAVVTD